MIVDDATRETKLLQKILLKNNESLPMLSFQSSLFSILRVNVQSSTFDVRETERESEKDY